LQAQKKFSLGTVNLVRSEPATAATAAAANSNNTVEKNQN